MYEVLAQVVAEDAQKLLMSSSKRSLKHLNRFKIYIKADLSGLEGKRQHLSRKKPNCSVHLLSRIHAS